MKVNAVIDLIAARRPQSLDDLAARHADYADFLRPGLTLGDRDAPPAYVLCDLLSAGVAAAKEESTRLIDRIRRKAISAKRVRLAGELLTAVLSAGAFLALILDARTIAAVSAGGTLVAALAGLLVSYLEAPLFGTAGPTQLIEECLRLDLAIDELDLALAQAGRTEERCKDEIGKLQGIASGLKKISIFGGLEDSRRARAAGAP